MSLKPVYDMLEVLANTPSTNDKEELLVDYLKNKLFLKVCKYTLDPRKKFKVKKFPTEPQMYVLKDNDVDGIFEFLDKLNEQKGASKSDKDMLYQLASIDTESYEVVKRICNGDLRCGVGTRTINTVKANTIPFTAYLRCSSKRQLHKAKFPAYWQIKANGKYAEMICRDKIYFGSRDSHKLKNLKHLKKMYKTIQSGFGHNVYMGELRVWNTDGTIMGRQEGNGIINTKDLPKKIAKRIFFSLWDCVPYCDYFEEKCLIPYEERLKSVREMVAAISEEYPNNKSFAVIKTDIVQTIGEAQALTNAEIEGGGEGGVLKNKDATWKHGTSMEQFKMKRLYEGELRVLAWEYGTKGKKHADRMGRILIGTDDGKVQTYCGGGFSDKLREENWDKYIGRIVEVEYEEVTLAKGATVYALSGPCAFVDFRDGKDTTDTFEELTKR
jgi:hypothetical protein